MPNLISDRISKDFISECTPVLIQLLLSLYLEPPSSSNTDHSESQNYFVIFMHDASFTQKVLYFILDANNRNAAYIRFSHDFNTAQPEKRIQHINDGYKDTLSYLQYLNGVYTKIYITWSGKSEKQSVL